ncbi:MAG: acyl-CoA dehydrogenase family protein [Pseudomonadales bacterium]
MSLESFRQETREWLEANCPMSMRNRSVHFEEAYEVYSTDDAKLWLQRAVTRGWTAPTWDTRYGGGGLDREHARILQEEMLRIRALPPATGMGFVMIGPTLLEFGTEEQKMRHLPRITSGEVTWCQGYSEPGAGSDLAGLRTKAELVGDEFVINGQKIWTTGGDKADWMFVLVRTDPSAPKQQGISFLLIDMHQPGVTVKPIALISGSSPFCETFFDNAIARKDDLVGELNKGWTVAKRLLQYERSGATRSAPAEKKDKPAKKRVNLLARLAKTYVGEDAGRIAEPALRREIVDHNIQETALALTARRTVEEAKGTGAPGAATSIFKYVGSTLAKNASELRSRVRGVNGLVLAGDGFSEEELDSPRQFLRDRAVTIYGGTNEIQLNIIAKRVLGLPD